MSCVSCRLQRHVMGASFEKSISLLPTFSFQSPVYRMSYVITFIHYCILYGVWKFHSFPNNIVREVEDLEGSMDYSLDPSHCTSFSSRSRKYIHSKQILCDTN